MNITKFQFIEISFSKPQHPIQGYFSVTALTETKMLFFSPTKEETSKEKGVLKGGEKSSQWKKSN